MVGYLRDTLLVDDEDHFNVVHSNGLQVVAEVVELFQLSSEADDQIHHSLRVLTAN